LAEGNPDRLRLLNLNGRTEEGRGRLSLSEGESGGAVGLSANIKQPGSLALGLVLVATNTARGPTLTQLKGGFRLAEGEFLVFISLLAFRSQEGPALSVVPWVWHLFLPKLRSITTVRTRVYAGPRPWL
jgi:hypothetical protein